jgi:cytochrome c
MRVRRSPLPLGVGSTQRRLAIEQLEPRMLLASFDVLVFSKTVEFRHTSIAPGIAAIQALGAANDFSVTTTEDANAFNAANLASYEAVVFLNTTGDILNAAQELALQQYIQNGGGWAGIHSAADTEHAWPWYGQLVGAYFQSHPAIQQATIKVADQVHESTAHLPERWVRTDEWYNYTSNPRGNVHVLMTLDEATYSGGVDGFDHPIAWMHEFAGGRSWYTGLGHTDASYSDPLFRQHLLGGIRYAAGQTPYDSGATINANWQKTVLEADVNNGVSLAVAPDGRVFFTELWSGRVRVYDPATQTTSVAADLDVFIQPGATETNGNTEDGLAGIALDPDFAENGWVYLFYSPAGPQFYPVGVQEAQYVSRFTMTGNTLDLGSEKVLLQIPVNRVRPGATDGHAAGSLTFGPDGALYIATGDDTTPHETSTSGYAPIDERAGNSLWDVQRSSGNTNDLRGKILRIVPEDDGTYSIPPGNLFAGDAAHRAEIYVMGNRNPYRIAVDSETGWLYWGDVGPDANSDSSTRGPRGYDEINQARSAGNYGWPYIIADNKPYRDYNWASPLPQLPLFDPNNLTNNSPNNTGDANLPDARPALIWYPYATSTVFPEFGTGGRLAAVAGVYHFDAALDSSIKLPEYYDDVLIMFDWSREAFFEVRLDAAGQVLKINRMFPNLVFDRPIDVKLGPDGALYVLEWGDDLSPFVGNNPDAQLVRIEFLGSPRIVSADFDENGSTNGNDFLLWQRGLGLSGGATRSDGDANVDGRVDAADLTEWRATAPAAAVAATSTSVAEAFAFSQSMPTPSLATDPDVPWLAMISTAGDREVRSHFEEARWRGLRDSAFATEPANAPSTAHLTPGPRAYGTVGLDDWEESRADSQWRRVGNDDLGAVIELAFGEFVGDLARGPRRF